MKKLFPNKVLASLAIFAVLTSFLALDNASAQESPSTQTTEATEADEFILNLIKMVNEVRPVSGGTATFPVVTTGNENVVLVSIESARKIHEIQNSKESEDDRFLKLAGAISSIASEKTADVTYCEVAARYYQATYRSDEADQTQKLIRKCQSGLLDASLFATAYLKFPVDARITPEFFRIHISAMLMMGMLMAH